MRDYKREYAKYGSKPAARRYRSQLNKYNRQHGTYGNGDGKDAIHVKGKIKGFQDEHLNKANNRPTFRASKQTPKEVKSYSLNNKTHGVYLKVDGRKYPIKKKNRNKSRNKMQKRLITKIKKKE